VNLFETKCSGLHFPFPFKYTHRYLLYLVVNEDEYYIAAA